ncbi:MAG: hypothetical protein NZ898_16935, partial [Myxococcota bacterium]|nr:hypothetical protein [Myxococcota bacterium]
MALIDVLAASPGATRDDPTHDFSALLRDILTSGDGAFLPRRTAPDGSRPLAYRWKAVPLVDDATIVCESAHVRIEPLAPGEALFVAAAPRLERALVRSGRWG